MDRYLDQRGVLTAGGVSQIVEKFYSGSKSNVYEFEIPAGTVGIGQNAFAGFSNLESVVIPEGVIYIGRSAFERCENLAEVIFPTTLRYIDDRAFFNCFALEMLDLPDEELELISTAAFAHCHSLRKIVIPGCVKTVEAEAFKDCRNVRKVVINEGVEFLGKRAFGDIFRLWHFSWRNLPSTLVDDSYRKNAFLGSTCSPNAGFFRHPIKKIRRYIGREWRPYWWS